ncbi:hypothetical protein PENSPDRAFT_647317 [Peniophora sp. CONT]|nr:hypothetical protein PENSPDRAFT_647317 [Peniophora sp. CONT]
MSRPQPSSVPKLLNEPLAAVSIPQISLMDLPNELLTAIVKLIGPPDASCCDPGWFVVPAVCRRIREVTEKIAACWESGEVFGPGGDVREKYEWRTFPRYEQIRLPADNPSKEFSIHDERNGRNLSFSPAYKGGSVKYFGASLNLSPKSDEDTVQAIDRYLSGSPVPGLPRLNLTWMASIEISRHGVHVDQENFSFANVPCIVAPALQELRLSRYVVDWRCHNLKRLTISMGRPRVGEPFTNYRYPPTQLIARIHDSRRTLEHLQLSGCLPTVPENDPRKGRAPVPSFRRLRNLDVLSETPREAAWLCAQIGFPASSPPLVHGYHRSAIGSLRSLACAYAHSVPDPQPAPPGFHGELDALTFRNGDEYEDGCIITAFSIGGIVRPRLRQDPTAILALYAQCCIARYVDYDREQDVRELDGRVPGIEPKFVTKLGWNLDDWNVPPSTTDACGAHCSALHGIKHVSIEGFDSRLFRQDADAQVWTAVLRHLPNVRSLYIYAPSSASLAPLINEPDLLPSLEYLWLGCDDESKGDDDIDRNFRYGRDTDYNSESDHEPESDSEEVNATLEEGDANLEGDANSEEGDVNLEAVYAWKPIDTVMDSGGKSVGIDDLIVGGYAKGGHLTSVPDEGALNWDSQGYTDPKAKERKIDAGLLFSILKSRNLTLRLVNLTVVGDPQSV